jgi:hypothetical protein
MLGCCTDALASNVTCTNRDALGDNTESKERPGKATQQQQQQEQQHKQWQTPTYKAAAVLQVQECDIATLNAMHWQWLTAADASAVAHERE